MIAAALSAIVAGMALVRIGWGSRFAVAVSGWLAIAASLFAAALASGAWGLAVGTAAAMAAAFAGLCWSAWTARAGAGRPERERVATMRRGGPLHLARRVSAFALVVPGAGAAALVLAFGVQAVARRAGMGAADAAACLLFLLPVLWIGLTTWQMTREGPNRMIAPPLLAAAIGLLLRAAA